MGSLSLWHEMSGKRKGKRGEWCASLLLCNFQSFSSVHALATSYYYYSGHILV